MNFIQKLFLIFFVTAASITGVFISPGITALKKLFLVDDDYLSYIMTNHLLGYLLGIIFFAVFSKKKGGIVSIRFGLLISFLGIFLQFFSIRNLTFLMLLIGRSISAFGLASGLVCGFAIIKENIQFHEERKYLSIIAIAFTGAIYSSVLISAMLINFYSLESIFIYEIGYSLALFFMTFFIPNTKIGLEKNISIFRTNFLNPRLIIFSLALSVTTIITYCYAFYAPLIMLGSYGKSAQQYSYYNLLNLIGLFSGSILYWKFNKLLKDWSLIFSCLVVSTVLCILFSINSSDRSIAQFIFVFFLINVLSGIIYPAATYVAMESGKCRQSSSAIMNFFKISMPSVALYLSSFFRTAPTLALVLIIASFSFFSLFLLFILKKWFE